jgi:hypothetical protein
MTGNWQPHLAPRCLNGGKNHAPATDPEALNGTGARGRARTTAFTADSAQHAGSARPAISSPSETIPTKPNHHSPSRQRTPREKCGLACGSPGKIAGEVR